MDGWDLEVRHMARRCSVVRQMMWHCCMFFEGTTDMDETAEQPPNTENRGLTMCLQTMVVRFESTLSHRCEGSGSRVDEGEVLMC